MKKTAILGVSGYVGQRFVQMLYDHPDFDLEMLTGKKNVGKELKNVWTLRDSSVPEELGDMEIERCNTVNMSDIAKRIDVAFSALPSEISMDIETFLAENGVKVFSNSSTMRMDAIIPLVVPEVNGKDLELVKEQESYRSNGGCIIKNPNCSATGLVLSLKPIDELCGLTMVNVVTSQALSGAGKDAYPGEEMIDNVIPYIQSEEEKIARESKKLLHKPDLVLSASCNRVPVTDGHMEDVQVRVENQIDLKELKQYMRKFDPLKDYDLHSSPKQVLYVFDEENRPQPRLDRTKGNGMTVSVGRLRKDDIFDFKYVTLIHNTVKGAAGGSVLNAELFYAMGLGD